MYIHFKTFSLEVFKHSNCFVWFDTKLKNHSQTMQKNTDLPAYSFML